MENWAVKIETHPVHKSTPEMYRKELERLKRAIEEGTINEQFEFQEIDPVSAERLRAQYESIIMDPEKSLGAGNNGAVFTILEGLSECVKMRWETLTVENKSKNVSVLPKPHQRRKRIAQHFETANEARRKFMDTGADFIPQNDYLTEAAMTRAAHLAGLAYQQTDDRLGTPGTSELIRLSHEDDGFCDAKERDPYFMHEEVYMLYLEEIQGLSVEDMIYELPEWMKQISIEAVRTELRRIVQTLHTAGIVHRDITIRNVMIEETTGLPRLIDFGTATFATPATFLESTTQDNADVEKVVEHLERLLKDPSGYKASIAARHEALTNKLI